MSHFGNWNSNMNGGGAERGYFSSPQESHFNGDHQDRRSRFLQNIRAAVIDYQQPQFNNFPAHQGQPRNEGHWHPPRSEMVWTRPRPTISPNPPTKKKNKKAFAKYRRVGIVGKEAFTPYHEKQIKKAIMSLVNERETNIPPEFSGIYLEKDNLIAKVADLESENWLIRFQSRISEKSGCPLRIVPGNKIPKTFLFRAVFSNSDKDSTKEIFHTLESQSRFFSLSTEQWKLVKRTGGGNNAVILLYVDENSAAYIQQKKFLVPFRLGHSRFTYLGTEALPQIGFDGKRTADVQWQDQGWQFGGSSTQKKENANVTVTSKVLIETSNEEDEEGKNDSGVSLDTSNASSAVDVPNTEEKEEEDQEQEDLNNSKRQREECPDDSEEEIHLSKKFKLNLTVGEQVGKPRTDARSQSF